MMDGMIQQSHISCYSLVKSNVSVVIYTAKIIFFTKVIGFTLFLVDGKQNINKLDQKKKISISRIDKYFKVSDSLLK